MDEWNRNNVFGNDLNRSFSAPNINIPYDNLTNIFIKQEPPLVRRIFVTEEIYHNSSAPKIFRQCSYQELRSRNSFPECSLVQQFSNISFSDNFKTNSNERKMLNSNSRNFHKDSDVELIEEDNTSKNFHEDSDVELIEEDNTKYELINEVQGDSCSETYTQNTKNKKTEGRSILHRATIKRKEEIPLSARLIMVGLIMALGAIFLNYIMFDLRAQIDIEHLKSELSERVHEQEDAVHYVVDSLKYQYSGGFWPKRVKILNFVGSSGVGKTYIANIVKEHFYLKLVNDLHSSWLKNIQAQDLVINNLYRGYLNLIVIDDLTVSHLEDLIRFFKRIGVDNDDDCKTSREVLIIAIFNIQKVDSELNYSIDYEDLSKIHKAFDKTQFLKEIIFFNEFREQDARNWLRKQFDSYQIDIEYQDEIVNKILDGSEIQNHGFKKLHSKLMKEIQQFNSTNSDNVE